MYSVYQHIVHDCVIMYKTVHDYLTMPGTFHLLRNPT